MRDGGQKVGGHETATNLRLAAAARVWPRGERPSVARRMFCARWLGVAPEVARFMPYPDTKMDEMGIFSADWQFINPIRPQLIEKYNQVFGA